MVQDRTARPALAYFLGAAVFSWITFDSPKSTISPAMNHLYYDINAAASWVGQE
jgi:hypothetical protein